MTNLRSKLSSAGRSITAIGLLLGGAIFLQAQPDVIHHGDLVDVDVVGGLEFDWRGRINAEGFLDRLDGVTEPIPALCRTPSEVSSDISKAYSKFLKRPETVVKIIDKSSRPLAIVDGALATPARLQLNRWPTLREVIVIGGGLTADASGVIQIFRPGGASCGGRIDGPETLNVTVKDLLSGTDEGNPDVRHGDIVTVQRALIIYVVGGVANPGQIAFRDTTTLSRAVAASGGVARAGDRNRVALIRKGNDGILATVEHDLEKIEAKKVADPPLLALDIVEVIEKGSKERRYQPTDVETTRPSLPIRIVD